MFAEIAGAVKLEEFEFNVLQPDLLSDNRKLLLSIFKYIKGDSTQCINPSDILETIVSKHTMTEEIRSFCCYVVGGTSNQPEEMNIMKESSRY